MWKQIARSLIFMIGLGLAGCLATNRETAHLGYKTAFDVNLYPLNKVVCDPLPSPQPGEPPTLYGGLKADLYYLTKEMPRYSSVDDYIEKGKKSSQFFFFSELNVPTRIFSTGFPLEAGGIIKNDEGENLIEYFALRFASVLKLGPDDEEGDYELALLSDDGAIMRVREDDGRYQTAVENDGDHPTRLGCGKGSALHLTRQSEVVMQLDYFQGPRHHISVIPLWRKIKSGAPQAEPLCGATGNGFWFDSNNASKPTENYKALISRGWKPIAKTNYEIPNTYYFNPCVQGITPKITNFLAQKEDGFLHVTWTTHIPATSQVRYISLATGEDRLTTSDNILRTEHDMMIRIGNGSYGVQAISISDSYGKGMSLFMTVD